MGRSYIKLPWEMRQATRCRLCAQCMSEKRLRKRALAKLRPARPCRFAGCRRPADPSRYTICGYHYRRLPRTRRSDQRAREQRAARRNLLLVSWATGHSTYPLSRTYDDRIPAERKAHMLAVRARQKLKTRIRRELASGKRQLPPLYLVRYPEAAARLHLQPLVGSGTPPTDAPEVAEKRKIQALVNSYRLSL